MDALRKDVFAHIRNLNIPDTLVIVGNGPAGRDVLPLIPPGACTLALNGAILYPRVFDWWMAFDAGLVQQRWFTTLKVAASTRKLFGVELYCEIMGLPDCRVIPDYSFVYWPALAQQYPLNKEKVWRGSPLYPGVLRGQTTIAGCAVQFAYYCGVRRLYLVGVDMLGCEKANGGTNPGHTGRWDVANRLSYLCQWMTSHEGMDVATLSDTALKIRRAALDELC